MSMVRKTAYEYINAKSTHKIHIHKYEYSIGVWLSPNGSIRGMVQVHCATDSLLQFIPPQASCNNRSRDSYGYVDTVLTTCAVELIRHWSESRPGAMVLVRVGLDV